MSRLKNYEEKRHFEETPEPKPRIKITRSKKLAFVIHKHAASHLHYDLRLEVSGVLKSFAIPKGLPTIKNEKRLAIMTEDHPYEYKDFHGVIPKGHYGAGVVEIWDSGTYYCKDATSKEDIEAYMKKALKKGHVSFYLKGNRVDGEYTLIKTSFDKAKDAWLLLKVDHEKVPMSIKPDAFLKHPQIMLAKIAKKPFDDKNWLFEIKWDGYRALAKIFKGSIELISRNDKSYNAKFPNIIALLKKHIHQDAILDGEIVKLDESGRVDFNRMKDSHNTDDAIFYVFDLLYLDGRDLRNYPLIDRKEKLEILLAPLKKTNIKYSDHIINNGIKLFSEIEKLGLEGIMAKKINSPYVGHRSDDWLKIKTSLSDKTVIGGFTKPKGGTLFGALLLGLKTPKGLKFIGKVGTGFTRASMESIFKQLKAKNSFTNPFYNLAKPPADTTFVIPELLAEVSFSEWTNQGMMRHPVFKKLIDGKALNPKLKHVVNFTNQDKIFWPKEGITKGDIIDYYLKVAHVILPHLKDRPMVLNRHPSGITGESFFQKQAAKETPDWIKTAKIEHAERDVEYILVNDTETLLYVANLGCIELNPFHSRVKYLLKPDYMIIDLDPENVHFDLVIEVCLKIHDLLNFIGAENYCKTSGGRGLHIYVPLNAKYSYDQSQNLAYLIGIIMQSQFPKLVSLEKSPSKRQKKIYIDYLRNSFHQTVASVYCVRPKEHAPVSTPLAWDELSSGFRPIDFNIFTVPKRIENGDLFKPVLGKGIDLKSCLEKLHDFHLGLIK